MPTTAYCWRCASETPMLSEAEFAEILPHAQTYVDELRAKLEQTRLPREELFATGWLPRILEEYKRVTGVHETNMNAIWHHRLSIYGPPCKHCGTVLRTPEATFCFLCHRDQAA